MKKTIEIDEAYDLAKNFAAWYFALPLTERCTVHPPSGSGATSGIYILSMDQLFKNFLHETGNQGR